jgi:serine/threonine protein kinase
MQGPPPQHPLSEEIAPHIEACQRRPYVWVVPYGSNTELESRQVEVVRRRDATQAYQLIPDMEPRPLSHGGPLWGHLHTGFILQRRRATAETTSSSYSPSTELLAVYEEPAPDAVQRVSIKKLIRQVVDKELRRQEGGLWYGENPYKEIYRMQSVGDDIHVLACIEALQDDKYLYIISPYCERGSLADACPLKPDGPVSIEAQARDIFRQMLKDIEYLHDEHHGGICHRDIDPGNFLVNRQGRILLNDLAMSFRIPPSGVVVHIGRFGKPPYWPPEIFKKEPFHAKQCDLWACVVTLFNLLTGHRPYLVPHPSDILFRYCIMARGLSQTLVNELVIEVLGETNPQQFLDVCNVAQSIMGLSPQVRELFENTLCLRPDQRWTIEHILNCEWMTMM